MFLLQVAETISGLATIIIIFAAAFWIYQKVDLEPNEDWADEIKSLFNYSSTDEDLSQAVSLLPMDIQPDERLIYTNYKLTHGVISVISAAIGVLLIFTVILSPAGLLFIIVAYKMRKQPTYVFTDKYIYIIRGNDRQSYDYNQVSQLQVGSAIYERILGRGHIKFRVGDVGLEQIFAVSNHKEIAEQIVSLDQSL